MTADRHQGSAPRGHEAAHTANESWSHATYTVDAARSHRLVWKIRALLRIPLRPAKRP